MPQRALSISWDLAVRQFLQKYRGNVIGLLWILLNPLLIMLIYTVVFGMIFKGKYSEGSESNTIEYALGIFLGIVMLHWITDTIGHAANVINANSNLVKKVVFPLESLPISVFFISSLNFSAGIVTTWLAGLFLGYSSWIQLAVVPMIAVGAALCIGLAYLISAIGPFVRDLNQIMGFLSLLLLNGSAIFYSIADIPESLDFIIYLNPLMHLVQGVRSIFLWGMMPDAQSILILSAWAAGLCTIGFLAFHFLKPIFADVV